MSTSIKSNICDCGHFRYVHRGDAKYPPCHDMKCDCTGYSVSVNVPVKAVVGQTVMPPPG